MDNKDCVLHALKALGGGTEFKHVEDVAFKAWESYPAQFGWQLERYNYPDKEMVYNALKRLRKAGLVHQNKNTWMLTPEGIVKLRRDSQRLRIRTLDEVRQSEIWSKYIAKKKWRDEFLFRDMLNVSPDSSQRVAKSEFQLLLSKATTIRDVEVVTFLTKCSEIFTSVIGESK
jgi:hypothetical protein